MKVKEKSSFLVRNKIDSEFVSFYDKQETIHNGTQAVPSLDFKKSIQINYTFAVTKKKTFVVS